MFKVLLVDDEAWILAGLQVIIDWEEQGFSICGTAENGIEAKEKIALLQPDLILADIRMPGCDGLTLLRKLRQAGSKAMFAVISGYSEFEYAQECIKHGACGYLLKPVEEEELLSLLQSVAFSLKEGCEKWIMEELEQETGRIDELYPKGCWLTAVCGNGEITVGHSAISCKLSRKTRLYLSTYPLFTQETEVPMDVCVGITYYQPGENISFSEAVTACREASWQGFITPKKRFFTVEGLPKESLSAPVLENAKPRSLIQAFRAQLPNRTVSSLYGLYLTIHGLSGELQMDTPEWLLQHFTDAHQFLDVLENAEEDIGEEGIPQEASIARYMEEYFFQDISLASVGSVFAMSNSSVRRALLKEKGESFQQFLITLRMNHAADLLQRSDKSINEIAYSCGFRDALYFRKVFKKWYHVTPSEYRKQ